MASHEPQPDDSDRPTCGSCRHEPGTAPPLARGLRICAACLEVVEEALIELPALFELCADVLDLGLSDLRELVSETRQRGINLSETAVSVHSEILDALVAWSWFVTSARGVSGPGEFAIRELVSFLCVHLQWLSQHPGAPALVDELTALTTAVSATLRRNTYVRAAVGTCPLPDCGTTVYAEAPREGAEAYEVACEGGHVWAPHRWMALRDEHNENKNETGNKTGNGTGHLNDGDRAPPRPEKTE